MTDAAAPFALFALDGVDGLATETDKVAYLQLDAWPGRSVEVVETHMSYVFLTGDRAYKLKKPVVQPYLDYRSLEARRVDCSAEVSLNQALAPGVYLGVQTLTGDGPGRFELGGQGEVVDWLVVMRRLHRADLLDRRIAEGEATIGEVDGVLDALTAFYRSSATRATAPRRYRHGLVAGLELDIGELTSMEFGVADHLGDSLGAPLRERLDATDQLDERAGRLVDGHGDLRPEHVRPGPPPLVIDRLSFDEGLRRVDPYFDLALLAIECEHLGAPALGEHVLARYRSASGDAVDDRVLAPYCALRATTRARLSVVHLRDNPENPQKWRRRSDSCLTVARQHLARLG